MDRRGFITTGLGGAVAGVAAKTALGSSPSTSGDTFRLKYAPHFGMLLLEHFVDIRTIKWLNNEEIRRV